MAASWRFQPPSVTPGICCSCCGVVLRRDVHPVKLVQVRGVVVVAARSVGRRELLDVDREQLRLLGWQQARVVTHLAVNTGSVNEEERERQLLALEAANREADDAAAEPADPWSEARCRRRGVEPVEAARGENDLCPLAGE